MNELLNINPDLNQKIDVLQATMEQLPQVEIKPTHTFLPGMYIREIVVPAGVGFVTKIHNSAHPVFVCGICDVADALNNEVSHVHGYWKGITWPGTRRVFNVVSETIITTCHPIPFITGEENGFSDEDKERIVAEIESIIIEPHNLVAQ